MPLEDDIEASAEALLQKLAVDELNVTKPVIVTFLTSVSQDGSPENLTAQSAQFMVSGQAILVPVVKTAAQDTASSLLALVQLEADKFLNTAPGTTTATVASSNATAAVAAAAAA